MEITQSIQNGVQFAWSEADEARLAAVDRTPKDVAQAAKALVERKCGRRDCDLEGTITTAQRVGSFVCPNVCGGPPIARDEFNDAIWRLGRS